MSMLKDPSTKYASYVALDLEDRTWPSRRITKHPTWLSTDLRDGNQALERPMTSPQKILLFRHLVACGFKEIEVAFPSSSDTEFAFVRSLVEGDKIPENVWIQVLTPARGELIEKTFAAIAGARQVIIHIFNATAPCFREVVFGMSKREIIELATTHVSIIRRLVDEHRAKHGTRFRLAYGVEAFSQTEPEYVVEICTEVLRAWGRAGSSWEDRVIFNLPSTVEISPPNHYADLIEYFCGHMPNREEIIVSLHTHNDRGTAVAATELGLLAGAERVEGCLFGNGERSGNVDLVTVALNLYTQGIPCGLDFSDLQRTLEVVAQCTGMPVHPRHPYAGELVFTAFSGSHQDGIKKGLDARAAAAEKSQKINGMQGDLWVVPYLPLDPADIGRTYEAIVRVNSQSGKGGSAYIIHQRLGINLPRPVQLEFYGIVQDYAEDAARDLSANEIIAIFMQQYYVRLPAPLLHVDSQSGGAGPSLVLDTPPRVTLTEVSLTQTSRQPSDQGEGFVFCGRALLNGSAYVLHGEGVDPLATLLSAIKISTGLHFVVVDTHVPSTTVSLDDSSITAFVLMDQMCFPNGTGEASFRTPMWGVGIHEDASQALVHASISAINRLLTLDGGPSASTLVTETKGTKKTEF